MGDYKEVKQAIKKLKSMLTGGILYNDNSDIKSVWTQIKLVGSLFKGVRFPTHEEHQKAWDEFQGLVEEVKDIQSKQQANWEEKRIRQVKRKNYCSGPVGQACGRGGGRDIGHRNGRHQHHVERHHGAF
ncbi:MAG: hypothetical protein K9K66_14085 [Desulfarculaceae bacterium]|nr:hypothetical protein [Desulfarculaceae bacterium]MCF8074201.1 hypothetical protein [Desulfarculaceae bacterium]MCF8102782.1 hypothetical protein [Desulfarculaceae bacterium]MCF8116363.1 hypothetical protein [Desulfarculaceae bacterium]